MTEQRCEGSRKAAGDSVGGVTGDDARDRPGRYMQPVLVLVIVALEVVLLRRREVQVWGQISAGLAARMGLL